ncbi:MAG TPA: glycine zipper 2TM domain-containing protein [Tepidisphaeraceae bacterium]|jgi:uncharacterized membrane protein YebE (DUF533 family)
MQSNRTIAALSLVASLTLVPWITGCENLPGSKGAQGAVVGGAGGAAAGAAIGGRNNRVLGTLVGGAVGAGGGYLVGANWDKITGNRSDEARSAEEHARTQPADPRDVRNSDTADLNRDGFVTLDEVAAMRQAGLNDREMIDRLQRTGQYFELTPEQERFLTDQNVSNSVIFAMRDMNQNDPRNASFRQPPADQRISR